MLDTGATVPDPDDCEVCINGIRDAVAGLMDRSVPN